MVCSVNISFDFYTIYKTALLVCQICIYYALINLLQLNIKWTSHWLQFQSLPFSASIKLERLSPLVRNYLKLGCVVSNKDNLN